MNAPHCFMLHIHCQSFFYFNLLYCLYVHVHINKWKSVMQSVIGLICTLNLTVEYVHVHNDRTVPMFWWSNHLYSVRLITWNWEDKKVSLGHYLFECIPSQWRVSVQNIFTDNHYPCCLARQKSKTTLSGFPKYPQVSICHS